MPRLSVITITKNEAAHLARALQSVQGLADEIIVVDSESTDGTTTIAREFTEHVFVHPFEGYGAQKNFARQQATGEWVLHIDADEEVPTELAEEMRQVFREATVDFFFVSIVTEFLGRPLTHMKGTNLRLFRRTTGRWDGKVVHEQIERVTDGSTVRLGDPDVQLLRTALIHHSHYQTLAGYRERQEYYSTADAVGMQRTGQDRSGRPVTVNPGSLASVARFLAERAVKQFIRKFFQQKGFLDGWQGWAWCYVSTEYEYKMCKKYLRFVNEQRKT